jgi:hypothetical protein
MDRIIVANQFHNTWIVLHVPRLPATLTRSQMRRVRGLCTGGRDCRCWQQSARDIQGQPLELEADYLTDGDSWRDSLRVSQMEAW